VGFNFGSGTGGCSGALGSCYPIGQSDLLQTSYNSFSSYLMVPNLNGETLQIENIAMFFGVAFIIFSTFKK
jgi:hypothetical protein